MFCVFALRETCLKNIMARKQLWYSKTTNVIKVTSHFISAVASIFLRNFCIKPHFNTKWRACLHRCASMRVHYGLADIWHGQAAYSKIQQTKMLVTCQRFGDLFFLGWSGSILQFRQNIIKVGSKSWLLTCSSNITLSLPSYTGSALKRELNFCNGYLSLLYFC